MRLHTAEDVQLTQTSPNGVVFHGRHGERFTITALEPDIWRVTHAPAGQSRLDRTWMIVDQNGQMPRDGRHRDDLSPFSCPGPRMRKRPHGFELTTLRLRCRITTNPFALTWLSGDGRPFAADLPLRAYPYDKQGSDVFHYLVRRRDEHYFGFGEKSGPLDKHGRRLRLFNVDALRYNAETSDPLYKHIPFYITFIPSLNLAYGILYDNMSTIRFDLGQELDNYYETYRYFHADDGDIDYYLLYGPSVADVVEKLARLTGPPALLPRWSLGVLMSAFSPSEQVDGQKQVEQVLAQFQTQQMPISLYQLSSGYTVQENRQRATGAHVSADQRYVFHWNRERFPDPPQMSAFFHQAGVSIAANIKPALLTSHPFYEEVAARGGFVQQAEGDAPYTSLFWGGEGAHLDFTNPATDAWWREQVRDKLLKMGIDHTWNDNNEFTIWDDAARCHGFGHAVRIGLIRPLQALLMNMSSRAAQLASRPGIRPYLLSRAGTVGTQRVAQTWSGDNETSWHTLRFNIPMSLGMSLCNAGNYGHDIGGFGGGKPGAELFLRWVQSGIFQPRCNFHSWTADASYTSPWMHPEMTPTIRRLLRLRVRMVPYWYTLLVEMHRRGTPMIRPLIYDFPHDPRCHTESFSYMAGPNLLVAPVTRPGVRQKSVYLPRQTAVTPGLWAHFTSGAYFSGGQAVSIDAPLAEIPLFVPANGLIPLGDVYDLSRPELDTRRECLLFPHPAEGQRAFTIIEDDGVTENYQAGEQTEIYCQVITTRENIRVHFSFGQRGYPLPYDSLGIVLPAGEKRPLQTNWSQSKAEIDDKGRRRYSLAVPPAGA